MFYQSFCKQGRGELFRGKFYINTRVCAYTSRPTGAACHHPKSKPTLPAIIQRSTLIIIGLSRSLPGSRSHKWNELPNLCSSGKYWPLRGLLKMIWSFVYHESNFSNGVPWDPPRICPDESHVQLQRSQGMLPYISRRRRVSAPKVHNRPFLTSTREIQKPSPDLQRTPSKTTSPLWWSCQRYEHIAKSSPQRCKIMPSPSTFHGRDPRIDWHFGGYRHPALPSCNFQSTSRLDDVGLHSILGGQCRRADSKKLSKGLYFRWH